MQVALDQIRQQKKQLLSECDEQGLSEQQRQAAQKQLAELEAIEHKLEEERFKNPLCRRQFCDGSNWPRYGLDCQYCR